MSTSAPALSSSSTPTSPAPVPPFVNPFVEDENTVRARLLAAYPDGLSQEVGTWSRDWTEINVGEFVRQWSSLGQMLAQMFISWATGAQLDAWAASYGLDRLLGNPAYGLERFTAPAGTAIPPGAVLEVPQTDPDADRLRFLTTNTASMQTTAAGYIDVPIQALDVGEEFNVAIGAITLLDSNLPAVTQVSNPLPIVGGEDPETDDELRERILAQARLPVGAGSVADYQVWGGEVPGVGDAAVYSQWDTAGATPGVYDGRQNGSVLLVLRDPWNAPVDFSIVQAAQRHIAPWRQIISMFESYPSPLPGQWSALSLNGATLSVDATPANVQMGSGSVLLTFPSSGTVTATIQCTLQMDLSRFQPTDEIILWIRSSGWTAGTTVQLRMLQDAADYFAVSSSSIASDGVATPQPSSGAGWWRWRVQFNQFTKTGAPNWAGISQQQLLVTAPANTLMNFDYAYATYLQGATGDGGRAPVGADVTCIAPVPLQVAVTLTNSFLDDGYTLVNSPGQTNALALLQGTLNNFFQALRPGKPVRFVDIAKVVHDTPGWLDFTLSLPGAVGTPLAVPVAVTQDAILGTLTAS